MDSRAVDMRRLERAARALGTEAGRNLAEWWEQDAIGGRARAGTERACAERTLRGIEDGDPLVLDALPSDAGVGPQELLCDLGALELDVSPEELDAVFASYRTALTDGVQHEVARLCRAFLKGAQAS